jgi:hypothetical protein
MIKNIFVYTFLMCLCLISLQSVDAADITVNPGHSIQSAVDQASNGDTIIVNDDNNNPYTYKESIVINKKLNMKANGKVTIEAENSDSSVFLVCSGGSGSTIQNFRLTKSSYAVVVSRAKNCIIAHNSIVDASLVGIQFYGDMSGTKIYSNGITGSSPVQGNGISFEDGACTYNTVSGNTIKNFLNGILFNDRSANNIITKNHVYCTGRTGAGIYATDSSKNMQITYNYVFGAEDGIAIQKMGTSVASNYYIRGNTVKYNKNGFWIRLAYSNISFNLASYNKVSGIDVTGKHLKILNNYCHDNGICGIVIGRYSSKDYNTVSKNKLTYNKAGLNSASHYTKICYNYVCSNYSNGIISIANHTSITGNTITNTARRIIASGSSVSCQRK